MTDYIMPLEGKDTELTLSAEELDRLSNLPFKDKKLKQAYVLSGAPGAGKTKIASEALSSFASNNEVVIPICYDENGALFSIPAFQEEMKKAMETGDYEECLKIRDKYRNDSQRIRALTFNKAVTDGYNVFIDTTASSVGAIKMINTLKREGYLVNVWSAYAPADISKQRVVSRLSKPIHFQDEFVGKRYPSLAMMNALKDAADVYTLHYNPNNIEEPKDAYVLYKASNSSPESEYKNQEVLLQILNDIDCEYQADFYPNTEESKKQLVKFKNFVQSLAR
jgi:predicted ABC-type ATPase